MGRKFLVQPWAMAQPQAMEPPADSITEAPARAASFVSDLVVPLTQAAVTGGLAALLVTLILCELFDWLTAFTTILPVISPWRLGGVLWLACSTLAWAVLLRQTRRLLWAKETRTGRDLDGDGVVGPPPKTKERVVIVNAGQAQADAASRAGAERASEFSRFIAAIPKEGTSLGAWESELGRETYNDFRDALIRLGWARWKSTKRSGEPNKTKGWTLTLDVTEILSRISE